MFNRFFKHKDDGSSKAGPPGHRSSQPGQSAEELTGGGFFNLPPPLAKPYGSASPAAPGMGGGAPIVPGLGPGGNGNNGNNGVPPPTYGRPAYPQQPSYGNSSSSYEAPVGNGVPLGGGGGDMFDGMSLKASSATTSSSGYPPTQGYGAPAYGGASSLPQPITAASQPSGGSLFSGLDLAAGGSYEEQPQAQHSSAVVDRRKSGTRTTGSFNYLDVAAASSSTIADPRGGSGAGSSAGSARSVGKVVKKKKTKSFRPGFGRQLSDESVAALQRGDLKEEDVVQGGGDESGGAPSIPRAPINPTDLAHLLPPMVGGSVLSGLTVHKTASSASGSSSVLAGLTVHSVTASSPRTSLKKDAFSESKNGGVLAGLNVHKKAGSSSLKREDSNTSVVTASRASTPSPAAVEEPQQIVSAVPAAPPTPEERLLNTLRDFHASAVSFRENVLKQNDDENRILERKVQLANQLTQYEIDLRDVEAQQHHACEVEDFERADALNTTINSVRHCITLTESDVRKVESELAAFVKSKEKAFANQLRSTRGTLRELEKFRDDQESERMSMRNEFKEYEVKETEQLQFEAERIDTEMHHVSVNLEHLTAEKTEIEATIEEQCRDEFAVQTQLLEEKASVEEEVRELERKLKLKLERVREIEESIQKAEKDIDVVRNRYSRQLKRIADREAGILKTKSEVESDVEQLKYQKREFHEKLHEYETDIVTFGKRILIVRKEMRAAALLAGVLEVQETRREQSLVRKKQQTAELSSLSDAAAIAEQSFVMLRKQHDELEKSLSIHRNAIASAESMIPRLEQEKKTAAAQRNFKDAARISKDIKALEKDRSTAEEMVEVVEMELQDLTERIDKRQVEYEEKRDELKKVEKQLELTALQELWKEAKHLRVSIRKMEKFKSDGTAADNGVDFRSSALLLVQAEFDACMIQVEALEHKYDVSDPSKDQEDEADDDDDDDEELFDEDDEASIVRNSVVMSHSGGESGSAGGYVTTDVGEVDLETIGDGTSALEDIASKLSELEEMIEKATENEEYELAARLDEKIEVLKRHQHSIAALATRDGSAEMNGAEGGEEDEEEFDDEEEEEEEERYQEAEQYETDEETTPTTTTHNISYHQHDGHEAAGHDDQTVDELKDELEALRERIIQVEDDVDLATQNEEYEQAAAFDEELQELRAEQEEIEQLLANATSSSTGELLQQQQASSASLFMGLGVKQPSIERIIDDTITSSTIEQQSSSGYSSMFGGLEVNNTSRKLSGGSANTNSGATEGSSLFGGLELSGVGPTAVGDSISPRKLSMPPSPIADGVLSTGDAPVVNNATEAGLAIDSPTSYSLGAKDSFFGGLQVDGAMAAAPQQQPMSSTSMFGGLHLSGLQSPAHSTNNQEATGQSVFSGLTLSQTAVSELGIETGNNGASQQHHEEEEKVAEEEEESLASKSVLSTDVNNAMFAGLQVALPSPGGNTESGSTSSQTQSRTGSSSSLIEDEHSTDSPMTIHELSDHNLVNDDEEGSLTSSIGGGGAGIVSHESSFTDISFTSTSHQNLSTTLASTNATTTASTAMTSMSTASDSLFGGLSLMQSSSSAAATMTAGPVEVHATVDDDEEAFDDAKQEPTEL